MLKHSQVCGVTPEGKCFVVKFVDRRIRSASTIIDKLKTVGLTPAVLYVNGTPYYTGFHTWNGKDNGIFTPYLADAPKEISVAHAIDRIIENASAYDFVHGKLIAY